MALSLSEPVAKMTAFYIKNKGSIPQLTVKFSDIESLN